MRDVSTVLKASMLVSRLIARLHTLAAGSQDPTEQLWMSMHRDFAQGYSRDLTGGVLSLLGMLQSSWTDQVRRNSRNLWKVLRGEF